LPKKQLWKRKSDFANLSQSNNYGIMVIMGISKIASFQARKSLSRWWFQNNKVVLAWTYAVLTAVL